MNEFENTTPDPSQTDVETVQELEVVEEGAPYDGGDIPPSEAPVEEPPAPQGSPPVEEPAVPVESDQSETT